MKMISKRADRTVPKTLTVLNHFVANDGLAAANR